AHCENRLPLAAQPGCLSSFRRPIAKRALSRIQVRPPAFHPGGGCDFNSKLISFLPRCTEYFRPDVSLVRYQTGVMSFPGGGGPPLAELFSADGSFAATVT